MIVRWKLGFTVSPKCVRLLFVTIYEFLPRRIHHAVLHMRVYSVLPETFCFFVQGDCHVCIIHSACRAQLHSCGEVFDWPRKSSHYCLSHKQVSASASPLAVTSITKRLFFLLA